MSICLTDKELRKLTGKKRWSAQARVLNRLGIDNDSRPDGSIVVYYSALPGFQSSAGKQQAQPNFDAIEPA